MSDLRKAAEMALDYIRREGWTNPQGKGVFVALSQALAQPEQEPVAWMHILSDGHKYCVTKDESGYVDNFTDTYTTVPLYTAPPKREWVGLTEEELKDIVKHNVHWSSLIFAVENKLKKKNA